MLWEGVDPVEKTGTLGLDLIQPVLAVEERVEVDGAGARDAGPDVSADGARRPAADLLSCPGRRVGLQGADEKAHGAVEPVDGVDRLLSRVADIRERLVLERGAGLGDVGQIPAAVAEGVEVVVEIIVSLGGCVDRAIAGRSAPPPLARSP